VKTVSGVRFAGFYSSNFPGFAREGGQERKASDEASPRAESVVVKPGKNEKSP
jgi:hypothetical protein